MYFVSWENFYHKLCICIKTPHKVKNIQTFKIFVNVMFCIRSHHPSKFL